MLKKILAALGFSVICQPVFADCNAAIAHGLSLPEAKPEVKNPDLRRLTVVVCDQHSDYALTMFHARLHAPEKYYSGVPSSSLYRVDVADQTAKSAKMTGVLFGDKDNIALLNVALRKRNQDGQFEDVTGSFTVADDAVQTFENKGLLVAIKEW